MTPVEHLRSALSSLAGVRQATSRFGSRDNPAWIVAGREFAHLHSSHLLDLRLPRSAQSALRSDPRAHFRKSPSEWVELEFHTLEDVALLEVLVRKAWTAVHRQRRKRIS